VSTENDLDYDAKAVGKYITKLRRAKKLSMYQLALNSGISRSVLLHAEKGAREPRLNTVFRIIDGLNMRPAEFFKAFN
jgi:transcriptional regulator with XRE-family HTH domain